MSVSLSEVQAEFEMAEVEVAELEIVQGGDMYVPTVALAVVLTVSLVVAVL